MKELSGTARNFFLSENDKGLEPMVELILVVSEPQWHFGAGDLVRERIPETYRVAMVRGSLKALMKELLVIDEELAVLERKAARVSVQQPQGQNGSQADNGSAADSPVA